MERKRSIKESDWHLRKRRESNVSKKPKKAPRSTHVENRPSGKTQRIYEADINGAISHEQFLKLSADYEAEQKGLTEQGSRHGGTHRTNPTATAGRRSNWSKTSSEKLTYGRQWNCEMAKKRQDGMTFQPCRPATIKLLLYGGAPFHVSPFLLSSIKFCGSTS